MNILVTGGCGFIGSHLVTRLNKENYNVRIADKCLKYGLPVQEMTDAELDGNAVIYHLAATARLGVSLADPAGVIDNNIRSTLRLLEYCRKNPHVKLIVVSSSSAKFANLKINPYALSKAMCEQMVDLYRQLYKVKAISVRLFNVYGPGEADYGKNTTLIKQCKKGYLSGVGFYIDGDGSIIRDFTHVDDVCTGLITLKKDMEIKPSWSLYEIGSGNATITVKQIVEEFQKGTNLPITHTPPRIGDPRYTCAETAYIPTGWVQTINVLDYIRQWKNEGCPDD